MCWRVKKPLYIFVFAEATDCFIGLSTQSAVSSTHTPHTHQLSSKPKRSSVPNHRIKNGPRRAAAQGCFLTSAQRCCGHGAIRRDRGAALMTRRQHTAASPQGECQQSLTAAAQGEQALCRVSQPGSGRVSDHHQPSHSLPGPKCFNLGFANKYCTIFAKPRIPTMAQGPRHGRHHTEQQIHACLRTGGGWGCSTDGGTRLPALATSSQSQGAECQSSRLSGVKGWKEQMQWAQAENGHMQEKPYASHLYS